VPVLYVIGLYCFYLFLDNLNSHNDNVKICLFDNVFVFLTISR